MVSRMDAGSMEPEISIRCKKCRKVNRSMDAESRDAEEKLREKESRLMRVYAPEAFLTSLRMTVMVKWLFMWLGLEFRRLEMEKTEKGSESPAPEIQETEDDTNIPEPVILEDPYEKKRWFPDVGESSEGEVLAAVIAPFGAFDRFLMGLLDRLVPFLGGYYERWYEEIKEIGSGAFGKVFEVEKKDMVRGKNYAVKKVEARVMEYDRGKKEHVLLSNEEIVEAQKEVRTLASLPHPNIVECNFAWIEADWSCEESGETDNSQSDCPTYESLVRSIWDGFVITLYIEMELGQKNLADWLEARNQYLEECRKPDDSVVQESLSIFRRIVEAVSYMHSKGFCHGDIKPDNVLIDFEGKAKLADFGLTSLRSKQKSSGTRASSSGLSCGTRFEDLSSKASAFPANKNDVYCLGILLAKLLCPCHNDRKFVNEVEKFDSRRKNAVLMQYPQDVREILSSMRNEDPKNIPTASELLDKLLLLEKDPAQNEEAMEEDIQALKLSSNGIVEPLIMDLDASRNQIPEDFTEKL